MEDDKPTMLTCDEALAMLPDGDTVHVFKNPAGLIVGANWDRADVVDLLTKGEPQLSGELATSMGHGIAAKDGDTWAFIETKEPGQ